MEDPADQGMSVCVCVCDDVLKERVDPGLTFLDKGWVVVVEKAVIAGGEGGEEATVCVCVCVCVCVS